MERLRSDVAAANEKPPFFELKSVGIDEAARELIFCFLLASPHDVVRVRMSPEYCQTYPTGSVSCLLAGDFHVVPISAHSTVGVLARHIFDLSLSSANGTATRDAGDGMGIPSATAMSSDGMGSATESWSIEPTLEYNATGGGTFHGLCAGILKDIEGAAASGAVLHDQPSVGRAVMSVNANVKTLLRPTDFAAFGFDAAQPLMIHLTVDRAQYKAMPMSVQVGQATHFRANSFPPVAQQLSRILSQLCTTLTAVDQHAAQGEGASAITTLTALGYGETMASAALEATNGDVNAACAYLADATEEEFVVSKDNRAGAAAKAKVAAGKTRSAAEIRKLPTNANLLLACADYLRQRITSLSTFCVICDRTHVFAGSGMMIPTVCSRELCVFRFQKLDVGRDSATSVAVQTGVIDLLVTFARLASKSSRWDKIFKPFPEAVGASAKSKLTASAPNIELAREVLSAMPSVASISGSDSAAEMQRVMQAAHPLANSVFNWIMSSNKAYIVRLEGEHLMKWMGTKFQYNLVTSNPEREAAFNEAKRKHGSLWAFHGSRGENWHSILRNGLKNASGTTLQVNGSAYGAGIYLSPNASTSFGYSTMNSNSTASARDKHMAADFIDAGSMQCIAICEVVDHELKKSGSIWVQPHENYVITRFFFVFSHGFTDGYKVELSSQSYRNDLDRVTAAQV